MSLYAMPGLLPPLAFGGSAGSSSKPPSSRSAGPWSSLALYPDSAGTSTRGPSDYQGASAGADDPAFEAPPEEDRGQRKVIGGGSAGTEIGLVASVVAIREARIDAARLIQALVLGTGTNNKTGASAAASSSAPRSRIRTRPPRLASSSSAVTGDGDAALPITVQEECMEFELSIRLESHAGCWSYDTTRRLECFLELRRELVREFEFVLGGACGIPPVPRVQNDEASSWDGARGNSGGGFVFLQALLRSYVPVLEAWLRTVLERLPVSDPDQSGALSEFLRRRSDDHHDRQTEGREAPSLSSRAPPVQSRSAPYKAVSPSQSNSSFRPLDSIEESEEVEC